MESLQKGRQGLGKLKNNQKFAAVNFPKLLDLCRVLHEQGKNGYQFGCLKILMKEKWIKVQKTRVSKKSF